MENLRCFILSQNKENCVLVFTVYVIDISSCDSSSTCYPFPEVLGYYMEMREGGWKEEGEGKDPLPSSSPYLTPVITQRATKPVVFKLPGPDHLQVIKSI